jgi:hypothetical protein
MLFHDLKVFNMELEADSKLMFASLNTFGLTCLDHSKIISLNYNFDHFTRAI